MSAGFTPGPWKALSSKRQGNHVVYSDGGIAICSTGTHSAGSFEPANASLIAAAPELYELAEQFERVAEYELRKLQREKPGDDDGARLRQLNLNLIRAALAKARGEQP